MDKDKLAEEIKKKIAIDNGFDNWEHLLEAGDISYLPECTDEYAELYHEARLKEVTDSDIEAWVDTKDLGYGQTYRIMRMGAIIGAKAALTGEIKHVK